MNKKPLTINNATPHDCTLLDENHFILDVIKPSGRIIRIPEECNKRTTYHYKGNYLTICNLTHSIDDLPIIEYRTFWIVSRPVAMFYNREDFIVPDDVVRDKNGHIVGCKKFATFYEDTGYLNQKENQKEQEQQEQQEPHCCATIYGSGGHNE